MDSLKLADSADKKELFNRIDNATNKELAQIYESVAGFDPFKKYGLVIPSEVRTRTIETIKKMIVEGAIMVTKPRQ